ncbi:hypothetical protein [Marinobacter sp.]|uniref:hypothetical protein n=1 Tax=Marinobacter sp. TaxID=50741 RepID=UPI0035676645
MTTPVDATEYHHAIMEEAIRCKALLYAVLTALVEDAQRYAKGKKPTAGQSEEDLRAAYDDVVEGGEMVRRLCGLLDIDPDYIRRLVTREGVIQSSRKAPILTASEVSF